MVRHQSARRGARRAAAVLAVLAVLAGCAAALAGLLVVFSTTESPTEGPIGIVLVLGLLALPMVLAAVLIARIMADGGGRDDDRFLP